MATKPVIVGADGSRESLRAVEWAAREAALRGTSLRIVAVPPLPPRMTSTPATPGTVSDVVEQSTSEALAAAAQQAAAQQPSLTIETHLVAGAPGRGPDRGRGGRCPAGPGLPRRRGLQRPDPRLGDPLRRDARAGPGRGGARGGHVRAARDRGRCPGPGPVRGGPGLRIRGGGAAPRAAARGARLVFAGPRAHGSARGGDQPPGERGRRLAGEVPRGGGTVEMVHAHPGRVLAGSSARADLVVLGRHAPGGSLSRGVGSVTHAVLGHAHGPVVSVPGD